MLNGGGSELSNSPRLLRHDADIENKKKELSHDTLVNLNTDTSAYDTCGKSEECSSSLQPAEIIEILETDTNDAWYAKYTTLIEISLTDASGFKLELPFNPDIDQMDEEGYTHLYKAALEGHLEGVEDLISLGANPSKPSKGGLRPLHAAVQEGHTHLVDFPILQGADVNVECDLGQTLLHTAAANGYADIVETFISEGSDVNKVDGKGLTPFNTAVQYHLEAAKYLMTKGVKQNRHNGKTPLYTAARFGHVDIVEFLISKGTDLNEENNDGSIPLHGAAIGNHMKVMKYLIQQGSDVNKEDAKGLTPFNVAVLNGHLEAVGYLMTKGSKQDRYNPMTPLHAVAQLGHLDIVKFFISKGADVNEENDKRRIPLHGAAAQGHLKVMEYLIQQGSHVNKADAKGWTPFNAAVQYGHLEAVKFLMTEGVKQNRYGGETPLYVAAQCGHLDIVKFLVSNGADVNEDEDEGMIPLHGAVCNGHMKVMEYLIQKGSDVNKKAGKGLTPLHSAVRNGHLEVVKFLMAKGAEGTRLYGLTPLQIATQYDHIDVVKFLVSNGYDVNERNERGESPLHAACYIGNIDIVNYLLLQNANVNEQDHDGWTPLHAAAREGHRDVVDSLTLHGAAINVKDIHGLTPLQAAENAGHSIVLAYVSLCESDTYNEDPRSLKGDARNLTTRGSVVLDLRDADTQSCEAKSTSQIGNMENRNDCPQADIAKRGADELALKNVFKRIHDDDKDAADPNVNEHLSQRRGDPNEEGTGHLLSGNYHYGAMHLASRDYAKEKKRIVEMKETDTQSRTGHLTSQVDNEDDGNDCNQANNAKGGIDEISLKNLSTMTLDVKKDVGRPNVNEHLSPRRGDRNEEDTEDPLSGGHHYNGAKHDTIRGNVTKKKVVLMNEVDTKSRTEQLASHVNNVEDRYDCNQADNARRGVDELSVNNPPTMTLDDDKGGNEEHNPFIHAKLKYPDKGKQDPMLDQIETSKCPGTRKRDTTTSPYRPQTWQYSGCDPTFLRTMETDDHSYEKPESSCPSLTDENRQMRKSSTPMDAGNDLQSKETSTELERFPTHPPAVVHQKLYDENPVSTQSTSSNPIWKIGTKLRTSVDRCPLILTLVRTFLQMIIVLAIILAGSPVLVAGSDITERVTLQAGKPGVVPFHLPWPPNSTSREYFTLGFKSKPRPFCINGEADVKGFKSPSQLPRFTTSVTDLDTSPCVNLMIDNVEILDEDGYVLTAIWDTFGNVRYETLMKEIVVLIPPGRAKCFIILSENVDYPYEVHCEATTGSVYTTLSCYQNDQKIDVQGDITDNGQVISGIFLLPDDTHFSCCLHDVTSHVSETMCNDFVWPHGNETTRQSVNTVPTSVTTPTPQIESHTGSGACRQFMLPSLFHFTYLFIYLLAFFTMY